MPIKIDVRYSKIQECGNIHANVAYDYLSDFERSVPACFPGIEKFESLGNGGYRWVFEKIAHSGYEMQIKLVTRLTLKKPHRIEMEPLPEPGSSTIKGFWEVDSHHDKARVKFDADLVMELPLPFFVKAMAAPIVQKELTKLFDRYLSNVAKALAP